MMVQQNCTPKNPGIQESASMQQYNADKNDHENNHNLNKYINNNMGEISNIQQWEYI